MGFLKAAEWKETLGGHADSTEVLSWDLQVLRVFTTSLAHTQLKEWGDKPKKCLQDQTRRICDIDW